MPSYIIPKKTSRDIVRVVHVFPAEIGKKAYAERLGYEPSEIESAGHFKGVDSELDGIDVKPGSYTLGIEHSRERDLADLAIIAEFLKI